ncbi:hypothetical protein EYF80_017346 [Liparis tanakae]|uniref:Uncharacterized protein n=1 Tax=Liparis tanakae TaxID=230148 RepID=A0A4Z2I3M7_9TELE|nr:hypothetical protein EYF80_017346 [Liparis tanakae]
MKTLFSRCFPPWMINPFNSLSSPRSTCSHSLVKGCGWGSRVHPVLLVSRRAFSGTQLRSVWEEALLAFVFGQNPFESDRSLRSSEGFEVTGRIRMKRVSVGLGSIVLATSVGLVLPWKTCEEGRKKVNY